MQLDKYVRSFANGRLRIRHPALVGLSADEYKTIETMVLTVEGITSVQLNPSLGSALLLWDPLRLDAETLKGHLQNWLVMVDGANEVAVSVAALLTAAGVFICLVALLYIINPAGMRAALKVLADKVDAWLAKAHEWLDGLKEILSAFQSAAQAAAGVSQEEKKQGFDEATPEPKPQDKDEMEQTPNRN